MTPPAPQAGELMAPRARVGRDERGRVNVYAAGRVVRVDAEGNRVHVRLQRRVIVREATQEASEKLAAEIAAELTKEFALGDLSFFEGGKPKPLPVAPPGAGITFAEWWPTWLATYEPPTVGQRCYDNYATHGKELVELLGARALSAIGVAEILEARRALGEKRKARTVTSYLGTLRLCLRDAEIRKQIAVNPFATALPRQRTKRGSGGNRKRVTFRPFIAAELALVLDVVRAPQNPTEALYFPLTEFLLLTGLRWGEGAAVQWSRASRMGRLIHVDQSYERGSRELGATKTAETWTIPMRPVLLDLLERQEIRCGGQHGGVFPGVDGTSYWAWRKIGWLEALKRAKVAPREGDAQKACRRSYITSSLICGRNPKQVAGEVGHTTMRMVTEQYDSFIDPTKWPDPEEIQRVAELYGWPVTDRDGREHWAPGDPSRALLVGQPS
jgi:integrase